MKKLHIGIDPDLHKSGYALWWPEERKMELFDYTMYELMCELLYQHRSHDVTVYLEAGHTVKKHWHKKSVGTANNVGKNHAVGQIIEAFLKAEKIPYMLLKPAGYSNYDHGTFCKITGWPVKVKTNPEKRAAGMMVFGR